MGCPAAMLMAAFTSAWQAKPQAVHRNTAWLSTRVPVHLPARRAPLAGERGADLLHPARGLVLQPAHQQPPPRPQDAPVQPGLGADVAARVLPGAFRGPGHGRRSSGPRPGSRRTAARCRWTTFSTQSLRRSLSRARSRAIACFTRPRRFDPRWARASVRCRRRSLARSRAVRAGACSSSPVDRAAETATPRSMPTVWPLPGAGTGAGITANATCQRPGPVPGHPVGLHARRHRTGPAEPHPPGLRHPDLTGFAGYSAHVPLPPAPPGDPEPLIPPGLAPRRPPGRVAGSKNAAIAWAKSRSACCWTVCEPAASHGCSARAAVSCRHCSR